MSDVTLILQAIDGGDAGASRDLLPIVYDELRQLAARRLADERRGHTLQATELVHEAFIKLVGPSQPAWRGKAHFFAAAAEAMRRILIDNARRKRALRHGGDHSQVEFVDAMVGVAPASDDVLALDEALTRLAAEDKVKADLVKLRYFAGLTIEEAAVSLEISRATACRYWEYAKAWLFHELSSGQTR